MTTLKYLLIFPILWCSCVSTVNVLKPEGDSAAILLTDGTNHHVELLALSDSNLVVAFAGKMMQVRHDEIIKISVQGYRVDPVAKVIGIIPILFVEGLVMAVAYDVNQPVWGFVSGMTIAASVAAFFSGEPKTNFITPFEESKIEKLRLYCRYPQGLSEEQLKDLLQHFQQDKILRLANQ